MEKSCGAVVLIDNKVLIVKQNSGFYGFPKGHMEKGESEIETACREVLEETNVEIEIIDDKRYTINYILDNGIKKEVVYFIAKPKSLFNIKKQDEEIENILLVDIKDVNNILTFDNLKKLWIDILNDINNL
ncbi:MAG: NUDIX domain-containing protein [Bacilli bacterium]|nr:NUDIX domain-containing protein [Bacilli bacterium]